MVDVLSVVGLKLLLARSRLRTLDCGFDSRSAFFGVQAVGSIAVSASWGEAMLIEDLLRDVLVGPFLDPEVLDSRGSKSSRT